MRPKGQPGVSQHPKFWWFLGVSTIFYFPFGDTTTWTRATIEDSCDIAKKDPIPAWISHVIVEEYIK
jgi:hypothetical protein